MEMESICGPMDPLGCRDAALVFGPRQAPRATRKYPGDDMKPEMPNLILAALVFLLLAGPVHALSPPPLQPHDELLPLLYESLDGDNWHRNDGWLDDEVHWCDWYGVSCGAELWGYYEFLGLELRNNNLSGELTEELAWLLFRFVAPRSRLDLADNHIAGTLDYFPTRTQIVDLSGNRLTGFLPEVDSNLAHVDDKHLLLARNDFEGGVPDSWQELRLRELDLADNRLDGGHINAFRAISRINNSRLDLAGNRFAGELTTDIYVARLNRRDLGNVGGGLRICFNDFTLASETMHEWIAERHAGGPDFAQCLGRERVDMDASVSGSWFNPAFDGEGVSLQLLDNGAPLIYSFSFDRHGQQQWLFNVGRPGQQFFQWDRLLEARGDFGQGIRYDGDYPLLRGMSRMRTDRIDGDTLHVERNYYDQATCGPLEYADPNRPPTLPCPPPLYADRLDYQRLTELAGTTCDNQSDFQQFSGAWYNPERDGEGFIIEVLPDDRALVYWFTYRPDDSGEQAWMIAIGDIEMERQVIPAPPPRTWIRSAPVYQPLGGTYGPDFDPELVQMTDWGELTITFYAPDFGDVSWISDQEEYGSGFYAIQRLARPMLAECE